jgi:2-hydroxy-6-oxonona-2,4-dienedioate hydrolase
METTADILRGKVIETAEGVVHYHDIGEGEPLLLLQAWGPQPGASAWLTYHKVLGRLSERYRCIAVDFPNYGLTGPTIFEEPVHDVNARSAFSVLDALGIERTTVVGVSVGATTALVMAIHRPERVKRLVIGSCHASTGFDPYLLGAFPSEVTRLHNESQAEPFDVDRLKRLLRGLLYDSELVTEDLVDDILRLRKEHEDHWEASRRSVSVPHSNLADLANLSIPTLIVHGRFDRMVPMEQGLMLLSYLPHADLVVLNKCGHWPPFERPDDYTSHLLRFLAPGERW